MFPVRAGPQVRSGSWPQLDFCIKLLSQGENVFPPEAVSDDGVAQAARFERGGDLERVDGRFDYSEQRGGDLFGHRGQRGLGRPELVSFGVLAADRGTSATARRKCRPYSVTLTRGLLGANDAVICGARCAAGR